MSNTRVGDCEGDVISSVFMLEPGLTMSLVDVEDINPSDEIAVKGSALVLCDARH